MRIQKRRIEACCLAIAIIVSSLSVQPVCTQAATGKITSIKLNTTQKTLSPGQTLTLKVQKVTPTNASKAVTWKTSNKTVATVTSKGKVTAKKEGTAKITVVSKSNKKVTAVCKITVKKKNGEMYSGTYQNTKWTIDKNGLLRVTGTGNMSDEGNVPPWHKYRKEIKSAQIEVTGVTNLCGIFYECENLISVNLSKLDTANVRNMSNMFEGCSKLKDLDLSNFDTSNVRGMSYMFKGCNKLKSLDLSNFDTSNVIEWDYMFYGCSNIEKLDLRGFAILEDSDTTDYEIKEMFGGCSALEVIYTPRKVERYVELPTGEWMWLNGSENELSYLPPFYMVLKRVEKAKAPKVEGDILYSGAYRQTTWTIDKNGLLKVTGTGNMSDAENESVPSWWNYRTKIKSAQIEVTGATNITGLFYQCENLVSVDLSKLDTSEVTNMSAMFAGCSSLTSFDVSKIDTSEVTNMSSMFAGCSSLTSLDVGEIDTSEVTNMSTMFAACSSLMSLDISKIDTSEVTDMSSMFVGCSSLTSLDISKIDTSEVTNMSFMFSGCSSLTSLDVSKIDTKKVTDMSSMFSGCSRITVFDFSNFDISNVTNIEKFLEGCGNLVTIHTPKKSEEVVPTLVNGVWTDPDGKDYKELPKNVTESIVLNRVLDSGTNTDSNTEVKWFIAQDGKLEVKGTGDIFSDTPGWYDQVDKIKSAEISVTGITNLAGLFKKCNNLTSVDLSNLDTANVTDMKKMFYDCSSLTGLDLSNCSTTNVTDMSQMFYGCSSLTSLDLSTFDTTNVKDMSDMLRKCDNLTTIHTPKKTGEVVAKLPAGIWTDSKGNTYTEFPKNATESIILNRAPLATPPEITGNLLYSGAYGNTTWTIDKEGLLEVKGIGDMYDAEPQWKQYCEEIKSARVEVTGANNLTGMFANCSNLSGVDFSKMDASNVADAGDMFWGCSNLSVIQTPVNLKREGISLPNVDSHYYWVNENGNGLNELPTGNTESISLKRMHLEEVPPVEGDISYSGAYGSTTWTINKDGLLEVKGIGNMYESGRWPDWHNYDDEIKSAKIEVTGATSLSGMFMGCKNLTSVDLRGLDTSQVASMILMFGGCENLTTIDLSNFNTSQVMYMNKMFDGCTKLESVNLNSFDTSKVTNMSEMFAGCSSLKSVDVGSFDTSQVTDMSGMFRCKSLVSLDLSHFDTSQVTKMENIVSGCLNLRNLKTPKKTGNLDCSISNNGVWVDDNGGCYSCLPKNAIESITLTFYFAYEEYGNVKWSIDRDGALLVTGNGEMYEEGNESPLWWYNRSNITSAKVEVTGATKAKNLFNLCKNMTMLDLSNFDMSNIGQYSYMLKGCDSLTTIYTPKKTGKNTPSLPSYDGYVWTDSKGTIYEKLPANATESIVLTKTAQ